MSGPSQSAGLKRKAHQQLSGSPSASKKRRKFMDARVIPSQTADAALTKNGELNITAFVKAREFEIESLEKSMNKARKSLSARAFQQVPRHLRRRTASHNAKKVPRRLQSRARREMIEDNTATVNSKTRKPNGRLRLRLQTAKALHKLTQKRKTVRQKKREAKLNAGKSDPAHHIEIVRAPRLPKNRLANPPLATSKFKRRQISKSWLPTHIWHSKRAHMTKSAEPLWRMAIPLSPTEKSYRATHRASGARGCIAWDMSYMSTICCRGTDTALEGLLQATGFHGNGWTGQRYSKWKSGTRFTSGWMCDMDTKEAVAITDVFWCTSTDKKTEVSSPIPDEAIGENLIHDPADAKRTRKRKIRLDRKVMIRVHPSAFHQMWLQLIKVAKLQKPQVLLEDLRFEIGSIELSGPGSTEALVGTMKLASHDNGIQKTLDALSCLANPALLPLGAIVSLQIRDPRLHVLVKAVTSKQDTTQEADLHEIMVDWPFDRNMDSLAFFNHKARYLAGKLPSQWSLNRRKKGKGAKKIQNVAQKDPSIPVILMANRVSNSDNANDAGQYGSWTLLAPWKCIDILWRRLLFYPLSTGSKPRFGGLQEKRQVVFEQSTPWFPGDFPGTEAGKTWERSQSEVRFDKWIRRPPSRRTAWDRIDLGLGRRGELGRGWCCDWEYLINDSATSNNKSQNTTAVANRNGEGNSTDSFVPRTQRQRRVAKAMAEARKAEESRQRNTSSPESVAEAKDDMVEITSYNQILPSKAKSLMKSLDKSRSPSTPALVTVRVSLLGRGTPVDAARIYRMPTLPILPSGQRPTSQYDSVTSGPTQERSLRDRWLALASSESTNHGLVRTKKDKPNHRGLPRKAEHLGKESLRHINVLPKDAPAEIIEQYGPKPLSDKEKKVELDRLLAIQTEEQKVWDTHIPCPDASDLIGFVTTGAYNLASGRGIALGSLWLQRILEGWGTEESEIPAPTLTGHVASKESAARQKRDQMSRDWRRRLCIVRNAGESIGRLGIWDVCG